MLSVKLFLCLECIGNYNRTCLNIFLSGACGASSGLLTCWSSWIFSCSEVITKNFSLAIRLSHVQSRETFYVANVYGTDDFCMELLLFRYICKGGWVVCDDFNFTIKVLLNGEAECGATEWRVCSIDLIRNLALLELPMVNQSFTWSSSCEIRPSPHFDGEEFEISTLEGRAVSRIITDHCPILLSIGVRQR